MLRKLWFLTFLVVAGAAHADPLRPVTTHLGWTIDVDTFVQVDATPWAQESLDEVSPATGAPLNQTSLDVRRGFVRLEGKKDDYRAGIEIDANTVGGPNARLIGAHVGWNLPGDTPPLLGVDAGLMLIPFGYEVPNNVRYRYFMEQPTFLRALFPGDNDVGVVVRGGYGFARWSVAAMNGAPITDAQWHGVDPSSSYDLIARVGGDLSIPTFWGRPHITFGISALTGSSLHPGTPPTKDEIQWIDYNQNGQVDPGEIEVIPGRPGEPSATFHHGGLGADARVQWCLQALGEGEAFFEGALSTNLDRGVYYADPIANGMRDLRELGFEVGFIQHLTSHGFAGIRYDRYDADRDAMQQAGIHLVGVQRVFSTWAFLAAAQWQTARLSVEYDHEKNPLGLSSSGVPTTISDDRVVIRAQVEM